MSAMTGSMTSSGSFNCLIHCNKITRSMKLFFKSEISREEQNELDRNKWIRNGLQWHEIFPYPVVPDWPKRTAIENGTLRKYWRVKKKKSGNEIKLSTKWLTKGRIELLMEEEESLLRRAIAAIAISLSWSGLWERVFGILWNAFLFGEGSGCGWVGGWGWFVKHILYMWLESALVFFVSLCHLSGVTGNYVTSHPPSSTTHPIRCRSAPWLRLHLRVSFAKMWCQTWIALAPQGCPTL